MQKIKKYIVMAVASFMLLTPALAPAFAGTASAADNIQKNLCQGTNAASEGNQSTNCATNDNGRNTITNIASKVVNIFSLVVGAIAVIMIIYGGFRYITSGGDSNNVGNAKNTLIYALVGLIIVALAQFIVHFVLTNTDNIASGNTASVQAAESRG